MKELVNREAAARVAHLQFTSGVSRTYGAAGTTRLRQLTRALDDVHDALAYELIRQGLTVFVAIDADYRPLPENLTMRADSSQLPTIVAGGATIQVLGDDEYLVLAEEFDPRKLAERAVVYHFSDADYFVIDGELEAMINQTSYPSIFGIPTFHDLKDALRHYRDHRALHSQCPILSNCWHDDKRWLLTAGPEHIMRDSLHDFLKLTLRGHKRIEVRPEQPVDVSHSPDIKVTWTMTNRLAYIEIKWMGKSVSKTNKIKGHSDVRSRQGAAQLAVYLARDEREAPSHQRAGYLVVFDARRRNVTLATTELAEADAMYFQHRDVKFNPDFTKARYDFEEPIRFFLAPQLEAA